MLLVVLILKTSGVCLRKYKNWSSHFEAKGEIQMLRMADCTVSLILPISELLQKRETNCYSAWDTLWRPVFVLPAMLSCSSHVQLFGPPWTVPRQDPLSMGFFRQEYWSGLLFPSPGDLPDPGVKSVSPAWQVGLALWSADLNMLQFMGSQRVGHDWATTLNWSRDAEIVFPCIVCKGTKSNNFSNVFQTIFHEAIITELISRKLYKHAKYLGGRGQTASYRGILPWKSGKLNWIISVTFYRTFAISIILYIHYIVYYVHILCKYFTPIISFDTFEVVFFF